MSRVIKFRAWDRVDKKWNYYRLEEIIDGKAYTIGLENWCEWTGLFDKDGKEIYEGDVVIATIPTRSEAYKQDYDQRTLEVKWDNEGADYDGLGFEGATYEVIGNVWENVDLLKG